MRARGMSKWMGIGLAIAGLSVPVVMTGNAFADDGVINVVAGKTRSIKIAKGKPRTIRLDKGFAEIVVGDPEVANVTPLTNQSFYVLGHKLGTTGIALFDENKKLIGSVDVEVTYDTQQLNAAIQQNVPDSSIKASTANGQIVLSGAAKDKVGAEKAKKIAKQFNEGNDVIDSVNITSSQQVQLQVRFVEINRQSITKLGVKAGANFIQGIGGVEAAFDGFTEQNLAGAGQIIGQFVMGGLQIDAQIDALETRGLARRLAEPNLIARSGEKASFLAGGEFPIPVAQTGGAVTIEFKKYGVSLDFTPTVLADGLISLDIAPEVSAIDTTSSYKGPNGISIPGFVVRRAQTSVDLKSGQSFMMAGLLQTFQRCRHRRLPGAGKTPVLGSLFSSKSYQRRETDLVIIVTPHLVRPIDPSKKTATPFDSTLPPSNVDLFGNNVDEIKVSDTNRAKGGSAKLAATPGAGHFLDLSDAN
jgi:pilus assembly protein CpaC